jgi:P27 family predicted phage terminase small subunit
MSISNTLEVLCEQYGIYRELKDASRIERPPAVARRSASRQYLAARTPRPSRICAMRAAFERYTALLKEFGLSPASRSRMDIPREPPKAVDPMEEVLNAK